MWHVATALAEGRSPRSVDGLLNFPYGGVFWPSDPVDALLGAPLVLTLGAPAAWSILCLFHLTLSGLAADAIARRLGGNGYFAGSLYAAAPITLSHLQNGASEAVAGTTLLAVAAWATLAVGQNPNWGRAAVGALALAAAVVGHAYSGVSAFIFAASLFLLGTPAGAPRARRWLAGTALVGALLASGPAVLAVRTATAADNVIGIKNEKELSTIRRHIGPADPEVYVRPGDFRSPDFRELSRYGEEFVHSSYLGVVPLLLALFGLRRQPRHPALWLAAATGLVLALGPVLTAGGDPVILPGKRAIPLPYLLLEKLPGFSSLSLLWRLAQLGSLALILFAATTVRGRIALFATALGLAEVRLFSPARSLPNHVDSTLSPVFLSLRDAPEGAVMNFPVVGSRGYLYEQTVHRKPVTGSLNFPNNNTSRRIWKVAVDNTVHNTVVFRQKVSAAAEEAGVRYLVLHTDARSFDDSMHTGAVRAIKAAYEPSWSGQGVQIYAFY